MKKTKITIHLDNKTYKFYKSVAKHADVKLNTAIVVTLVLYMYKYLSDNQNPKDAT